MRVVSGVARGTRLKEPLGKGTRPTSDKVREAIFNVLQGLADPEGRVLDLFAGTGALGIEALSRGAAWADFVEQDPAACRNVRENLALTKLSDRARVHCLSVQRAVESVLPPEPYAIILADPPYAYPGIEALMDRLRYTGLVDADSVVVLEHSKRRVLPDRFGRLILIKRRQYGDTTVSYYVVDEIAFPPSSVSGPASAQE